MATTRVNSFNLKHINAKAQDKQRNTMIRGITRIVTGQIVVIGECHLGVELGVDRIIEEGCNMLITIEMTSGEEILGEHYRGGYRSNYRNYSFEKGRGRSK